MFMHIYREQNLYPKNVLYCNNSLFTFVDYHKLHQRITTKQFLHISWEMHLSIQHIIMLNTKAKPQKQKKYFSKCYSFSCWIAP